MSAGAEAALIGEDTLVVRGRRWVRPGSREGEAEGDEGILDLTGGVEANPAFLRRADCPLISSISKSDSVEGVGGLSFVRSDCLNSSGGKGACSRDSGDGIGILRASFNFSDAGPSAGETTAFSSFSWSTEISVCASRSSSFKRCILSSKAALS